MIRIHSKELDFVVDNILSPLGGVAMPVTMAVVVPAVMQVQGGLSVLALATPVLALLCVPVVQAVLVDWCQ